MIATAATTSSARVSFFRDAWSRGGSITWVVLHRQNRSGHHPRHANLLPSKGLAGHDGPRPLMTSFRRGLTECSAEVT
jgi:hypothetical protein